MTKTRKTKILVSCVLLTLGARPLSFAAEAVLVQEGRATAVIVLAEEAHVTARAAAGELVKHIALMTGVELPVVMQSAEDHSLRPVHIVRARSVDRTSVMASDDGRLFYARPLRPELLSGRAVADDEAPRALLPIRIGKAADAALDELITKRSGLSNAFALMADTDGIQLRGLQPVGAQHAVYELLAQLGVRWFDPLIDGRIAPIQPGSDNNLWLHPQQTIKTPSDEMRWLSPVTPRSTVYTVRMKSEHIERVRRSRYAAPTPSSDENFVIGWTDGTDDQEWIYAAAHVPPITGRDGKPVTIQVAPQPLYGYCITDPEADGEKRTIVLTAGNHTEPTGCWSLHAVIEFLLSDDPRAAEMRRKAEFYVYPLVNPEGRYLLSRVQSPELLQAGWGNHNRLWNTAGMFVTIDTLSTAMRYDTRCRVDYLIDFHSGGAHLMYAPADLLDSAFSKALKKHEGIRAGGFETAGTLASFALHADGLRSPRAFTPENADWKPLDHCLQVGRNYALTLHDVLSGAADDAADRVRKYGADLSVGASPKIKQRHASKLLQAVARGDLETARKQVEAGDDINGKNSVGNTALHLAAEQGFDEIARWLLEKDADVTLANRRGWTPLHYAARYGNTPIAVMLITHGADVNARHNTGDTPLHLAVAYHRGDIVKLLIEAGADPTIRGAQERSPRAWAQRLGYTEIMELMQSKTST